MEDTQIVVACCDTRDDAQLFLKADPGLLERLVHVRRIAAVPPYDYLEGIIKWLACQDRDVTAVHVVGHGDPIGGCGGLHLLGRLLGGEIGIAPLDLENWVLTNAININPVTQVNMASLFAAKAIHGDLDDPQGGEVSVTGYLLHHGTQGLAPIFSYIPGRKRCANVDPNSWASQEFPGLALTAETLCEAAQELLQANQLSLGSAGAVALEAGYMAGQSFQRIVLDASLRHLSHWGPEITGSDTAFVVTLCSDGEDKAIFDAIAQLEYAFAWHQPNSDFLLFLPASVARKVMAVLSSNPTFQRMLESPAWSGQCTLHLLEDGEISEVVPVFKDDWMIKDQNSS